jgi:flagellar biosynthesis/type III secretory pathway protein FliH
MRPDQKRNHNHHREPDERDEKSLHELAYEDGYRRGFEEGFQKGYDEGYKDKKYNEHSAETNHPEDMKWHGKKSKSWYWL